MQSTPLAKACKLLGSYAALGATFDPPVSAQAVSKWADAGVPAERVIGVAAATNFDVRPHDLRPDLYPDPDDGLPPALRNRAAEQGRAAA